MATTLHYCCWICATCFHFKGLQESLKEADKIIKEVQKKKSQWLKNLMKVFRAGESSSFQHSNPHALALPLSLASSNEPITVPPPHTPTRRTLLSHMLQVSTRRRCRVSPTSWPGT